MPRNSISIGVPYYGLFSGEWTTHMLQFTARLSKNVEFRDVLTQGTMTADHSRNRIVEAFLKSDAEWLFWIDSDTMVPSGAVERMMSVGRTLVSGLYYGKNEPHNPIAYNVYNGAFTPIDKSIIWEKGELISVDATGMGCMLTHRSVYEDILKNYEVFQIPGGGVVPIHKNDILGDVETTEGVRHHEHDGKVYSGQMRLRLKKPTLADLAFPFFEVAYLRTEDMFFFDLARRVGHTPVLDSSVECGHLRFEPFTGAQYRESHGH
jgi:hypothetical protein